MSLYIFYKTIKIVISLDCPALIETQILQHQGPENEIMNSLGMNWLLLSRARKGSEKYGWNQLD